MAREHTHTVSHGNARMLGVKDEKDAVSYQTTSTRTTQTIFSLVSEKHMPKEWQMEMTVFISIRLSIILFYTILCFLRFWSRVLLHEHRDTNNLRTGIFCPNRVCHRRC